jgi:hypothetical protein
LFDGLNNTDDGGGVPHPRITHGLNGPLVARAAVGFSLVLIQLIYALTAHVSNCCAERYFAWAPNDYSVVYHIAATVNGRKLNATQILDRYRISENGLWQDPVERLEGVLRRRELVYGRTDRVFITVEYALDGRTPVEWRWSNDR